MNFSQIKNLVAEGETEKALSSLFKIMQEGSSKTMKTRQF